MRQLGLIPAYAGMTQADYSFRDKAVSFSLALLIHALAFLGTGAVLVKSAEYGVEAGRGGIEVSLVAAPQAIEEIKAEIPLQKIEEMPTPEKFGFSEVISSEARNLSSEISRPLESERARNDVKGDGSSPIPGKDPTTLYSSGGALVEAKPNYLKNPPPSYPETARKMGQEGLVELLVSVNRGGGADAVEIRESSGFALLDQAAVKAVRRWKFHPARIGTLAVDSKVEVPIRFRLSD